jgi:hypothetical protein
MASFFPFLPAQPALFQPEFVATVRAGGQLVDLLYGNRDSTLNSPESQTAATLYNISAPNLSRVFTQLGLALQQGNTNVDPNRDGQITLRDFPLFLGSPSPTGQRSELSSLAVRSGNPQTIDPSDIAAPQPFPSPLPVPIPFPQPVPLPQPQPSPSFFQPEQVELIRQVGQFIDGNRDGAVNEQEAAAGRDFYRFYNPNLSALLDRLTTALRTGAPQADPNRDGRMTYINFSPFPTFAPLPPDELTLLAARTGSPQAVETTDFIV